MSHVPLAIISVFLLLALVLVLQDRWRRGAFVLGVTSLLAAWFRLILPEIQAGLIAVRSKPFDVSVLVSMGVIIVWLTLSIDPLGTD
ncbi:DUF3017 domain-containing protein [Hoyosella sp. G463]|uniref:DUF3017 domain-containing protein n=1 Tax=Lolliginicoccus lacisalsi TaxID=2742202 RepID=A0A927PMG8_9ACTN|nr:DUF3017 domain-containing protein [Lolliginicoccus lacisalsi]MBD8506497.1 DUF3017 domain-containing protein [Lolliginicoccus lacisalsi]